MSAKAAGKSMKKLLFRGFSNWALKSLAIFSAKKLSYRVGITTVVCQIREHNFLQSNF